MIKRPEIELLKGHTVRIEYRTNKKAIKARIGTLTSIGIANVHIEQESGRHYKIPVQSVNAIKELTP